MPPGFIISYLIVYIGILFSEIPLTCFGDSSHFFGDSPHNSVHRRKEILAHKESLVNLSPSLDIILFFPHKNPYTTAKLIFHSVEKQYGDKAHFEFSCNLTVKKINQLENTILHNYAMM